jgi:hypothetical protein
MVEIPSIDSSFFRNVSSGAKLLASHAANFSPAGRDVIT